MMNKHVVFCLLLVSMLLAGTLTASCQNLDEGFAVNITIPPVPSTDIPNDNSEDMNAVDPRQYGAQADGITDDGSAIQKSIDVCEQKGGGIVVLKNGIFLSSPLVLKSRVFLKVEAPAILKALSYADYPNRNAPKAFLTATNASNFGIFGNGAVDGNGSDWWEAFRPTKQEAYQLKRPNMIVFYNSKNIIMKDITLQNSPMFNFVPTLCNQVVVKDVTVSNPANSPNTDGIDPSGSTNVFIDHCTISTGDDNIAIKGSIGPTTNVYITNNTFGFGHGLSIGSDFGKGVENVYAKNCTFTNTTTGIRIKSSRNKGGWLKNVNYSDMTMTDVGTAILITAYYPKIPESGVDTYQSMSSKTPRYQDVTITNVTATAKKDAGGIIGVPESPIHNVTLTNVTINAPTGMIIRNAQVVANNTTIDTNDGPDFIKEENGNVDKY